MSDITDEYLEYVRGAQTLDLEYASEFAVMAATLIRIKARMLLPSLPGGAASGDAASEEEDLGRVLKSRLLFYERIKEASAKLREFEVRSRKRFKAGHAMLRIPPPEPDFGFPRDFDLKNVRAIYLDLIRRKVRTITPPPVPSPRKTFSARLREVMAFLRDMWGRSCKGGEGTTEKPVDFWAIVGEDKRERSNTVLTLLVVLELVRRGLARICEQRPLSGFSLVGTKGFLKFRKTARTER